jgi:hypothetical protein
MREVTAQQALAMLVVNPAAALRVLETQSLSCVGLDVPAQERDQFTSFLVVHGRAFRASVLLLRKRRMDNVLDTLTVTKQLFSEYELACYWDDYLASLAIDAMTPKNPLLDSTSFGRFILAGLAPADPQTALVAYDVARNEVLAAVAADESQYNRILDVEDTSRWAPFVHPSTRMETFPTNVGTMVKLLASGKERNQVLEASTAQAESILFFKNWVRGGVGSLRANAAVSSALALLDGRLSAKSLADRSPAFHKLLTALDAAGAIARVAITETENES